MASPTTLRRSPLTADQIATAEVPNECFAGPCDGIDVVVFDSNDPDAPTTTYTGARQVVVDLAYSNQGDLLAGVPVVPLGQ